ncbi:MAG: CHAT domain-containing protein [Chloroflexi bacterium]|nr:CHAT domain-containing protein [Chloroflexota bacterium]
MPKLKTKVLVVFANPHGTDALRLGTEDRTIRESIRHSRYRDNISLTVCHAATIHDVRRALLDEKFHLVHMSGHGTGSGLILEDETGGEYVVPQKALAELFAAYCPPLRCIILNACYSLTQGKLISTGIPFTIAMEGAISDDAAIEFTRGFYDAIGAGKGIAFAYQEGCRNVKLASPNRLFVSQLIRKGELLESSSNATQVDEQIHFRETKAIVGFAIDVSGSMEENLQNTGGEKTSRLQSVRKSFNRLVKQARDGIRESQARQVQTSIDVFVYGFGFREIPVCDILSLLKVGNQIITKQEIEKLRHRYSDELQRKYIGYSGTRELAKSIGLGSLVPLGESISKSISEENIRERIALELRDKLNARLRITGETTMSIEEVARLWEGGADVLSNAAEIILGNTPMVAVLERLVVRFENELRLRSKETAPILFILSDGEPTDGNPLLIANKLKAQGVKIISCFVTDEDIVHPRILLHNKEPYWGTGASLMFEMASSLDNDSEITKFLLGKGWTIQKDPKLFVQLNHSVILDEFIQVVLSPLESPEKTTYLPKGI